MAVSGFGVRVSGFEFRVTGFEFRVWGLGSGFDGSLKPEDMHCAADDSRRKEDRV